MKLKLKSILLIILSLVLISGCKSDEEKIASHLDKGNSYFSNQEYKKAELEYRNVLQLSPENAKVWASLGETMMKLGQAREAFQAYSRVEQFDPENTDALLKLAGFFVLGKKPDQAKEKIDKILSSNPDHVEALLLKAHLLTQEKEFETAASIFDHILELAPENIKAMQGYARLQSFQKNYKKTEELLLKAIAVDPAAIQPRLILVSFYVTQKEITKAETQLLTAAEKNPADFEIQILLGNFYLRKRDEASAEKAYLKAISISPDTLKPYMASAGFYNLTSQKEKAQDMYQKAQALDPENIFVKNTIAKFQFKNKNIQEAETLVDQVLEARPNFFPGRLLKSEILAFQKDFKAASKILQELEEEEPKAPRVHYFQGICQIGLGQNLKAMDSLSKAVELRPNYIKARLLLADLYYKNKDFEQALTEASKIIDDGITNYRAVMIQANSLLNTDRIKEAEAGFKSLIKMDPENPAAYYRLGLVKSTQKEFAKAEEYLKKALALKPMLMDVFALRVRNQVVQKNFNGAGDLCVRQLELVKDTPALTAFVYNLQGDVYLAWKKQDQAKQCYRQSIEKNPNFIKPYLSIARIFLAEKNKTEAVEQYQALLEKNSNLTTPHMMLGIIAEMDNKFDQAETHYRKALEINPEFAPAANNLAYHLAERTENYDEALVLARTAKKNLPEDPGVMDTLGLVYYKKGLFGNAVGELLDSIEKLPSNPVIYFHLGLAYHGKGDDELAAKALKKALELDQNFAGAEQARTLLTDIQG